MHMCESPTLPGFTHKSFYNQFSVGMFASHKNTLTFKDRHIHTHTHAYTYKFLYTNIDESILLTLTTLSSGMQHHSQIFSGLKGVATS